MKRVLYILTLLVSHNLVAQFAPAAGKLGSTAIHGDSSCFVGWGISSVANVGQRQINLPDSGLTSIGNESSAVGKSRKNGVISLGDGGSVTVYFNPPIINGPGFDFAVFENAFNDSFLELAHVEISENGVDFYRFPSVSLTQTDSQTVSFGATFPEKIHNLAGKYRMPFGTPFDISEIDNPNLPEQFFFVRVIDVVGSIDSSLGSNDSKGNIINDPWPTNFASSGFDLDAIGVINQGILNGLKSPEKKNQIWFNQSCNEIWALEDLENVKIMGMDGREIEVIRELKLNEVRPLNHLPKGIYILKHKYWFQRISIQ